jgi:hypothetical protein
MLDTADSIRNPDLKTRATGTLQSTTRTQRLHCANTCQLHGASGTIGVLAGDGVCDDGGPGAEFESCDPSTDCEDCGFTPMSTRSGNATIERYVPSRLEFAFFSTNAHRATLRGRIGHANDRLRSECVATEALTITTSATIRYNRTVQSLRQRDERFGCLDACFSGMRARFSCSNTCVGTGASQASNGFCQDGGPGAETSLCALGSDCEDCGDRDGACANTCASAGASQASNGFCQDGGPGAETSICDLGADCEDCGDRDLSPDFSNDGVCDDGGPGAEHSLCPRGADCSDCGLLNPPASGCSEECGRSADGMCDDGGWGAELTHPMGPLPHTLWDPPLSPLWI